MKKSVKVLAVVFAVAVAVLVLLETVNPTWNTKSDSIYMMTENGNVIEVMDTYTIDCKGQKTNVIHHQIQYPKGYNVNQ